MKSRRTTDEVGRSCRSVRQFGLWLVWIVSVCAQLSCIGLAADRYEASLSPDDAFRETDWNDVLVRPEPRPWFLEQPSRVANSSGLAWQTRTGEGFQTYPQAPRCSSRRCCPRCRHHSTSRCSSGGFDQRQGQHRHCPSCAAGSCCPPFNPFLEPTELSFREDLHTFPQRWKADMHALFTCDNAVFLGVSAGVAAVLRNNVDAEVAQNVQQHGPYWGNFSDALSNAGDSFAVQIPLIAGVYASGLYFQDDDLHELGIAMFASFKFSVISSLALQYATGTHRSDGGTFDSFGDSGFPSTPVATSFALAAVVDERYGWRGGVPAYLLAGLVGWAEVDQNQHTVSDVVFGAALGFAIGKSIGAMHYRPNSPCKLVPLIDAWSGTQGIGIERRY